MVVVDGFVRTQLRAETAADHARVDALVERAASVADAEGAQRFLSVMCAVVGTYQAELDRSSVLAGIEPRSAMLLSALRTDLAELGVDSTPMDSASKSSGDGTAWGVGYVLEGSALGASILHRRAAAASMPLEYLSLLDEARPTRWPAFSSAMNNAAANAATANDQAKQPSSSIVDAARRVFQRVETELLGLVEHTPALGTHDR